LEKEKDDGKPQNQTTKIDTAEKPQEKTENATPEPVDVIASDGGFQSDGGAIIEERRVMSEPEDLHRNRTPSLDETSLTYDPPSVEQISEETEKKSKREIKEYSECSSSSGIFSEFFN